MKRLFLVVVVIACFVSRLDAQVNFGIKAGANFDQFKMTDVPVIGDSKSESKPGFHVGPTLQIKIPVVGIGIQGDVLYKLNGAQASTASNDKLHNVDVHLNAQYGFDILVVRPFVMAGPYWVYTLNKLDAVKSNFLGLDLGAGIDILSKVQISARYSLGLTDMSANSALGKLKNNTFSVSLAYYIF